jgi:hypothetical protein
MDFTATAGTKYWISIVPDVAATQWVWESGTGGDGESYQDFEGTLSQNLVDEAFTLDSGSAPEPVTTALVGGGLVLLVLARRRFKSPVA